MLPEGSGFSLPSVKVGDSQALTVSNTEAITGKRFTCRVSPAVPSPKMMETVVGGLENAPEAVIDMLHGANVGKMLVRLVY